ncbi:hypothetical protein EDD64_13233 [Effusibacillus lacus]|nr:hypothetical protein EDD64_13233 [Effusibacillus lacus]
MVCTSCNGTGKLKLTLPMPMEVPCGRCGGTGRVKPNDKIQRKGISKFFVKKRSD